MKKSLFLLFLTTILSCSSSKYYQVFTVSFDPPLSQNKKEVFYEDSVCKISFNFWSEKGNVDFYFHNKTNEDLIINLDETFFIINNFAVPYFYNRIFQYSSAKTVGITDIIKTPKEFQMTTSNLPQFYESIETRSSYYSSVQYLEQNKIIVPPKAYRKISEPNLIIIPYYYNSPLLEIKPKKQSQVDFDKNSTPFSFRVRISVSKENEKKHFDNVFYISRIVNLREDKFIVEITKGKYVYTKFSEYSPNKFYIKYEFKSE